MAILRINMTPNPLPNTTAWMQFIEDVLPFMTIFGLCWKAIDMIAKHFAEKRRQEFKDLIKEEVSPQIDKLTTAIDELKASIYSIRDKK